MYLIFRAFILRLGLLDLSRLIFGGLKSGFGHDFQLRDGLGLLLVLIGAPLGQFMVAMCEKAAVAVLADPLFSEVLARLILLADY